MTSVINEPTTPNNNGNITIKDVFDYVMNSPENTNPNVLKSMLSEMSGGGFDSNSNFLNALLIDIRESENNFTANVTYNQIDQAYKGDYFVLVMAGKTFVPVNCDDEVYYIELTDNETTYVLQFYPNGDITYGERAEPTTT